MTIEDEARAEIKKIGDQVAKKLAEPTSTWKHKPTFKVSAPQVINGDLIISIITDDEAYFHLNEGTSIRYATMTKGFVPKTSPGSFKAAAGSGKVAYRSKRFPKPGIVAREWTPLASMSFETILQEAIDRVCARYKVRAGVAQVMGFSQYTP